MQGTKNNSNSCLLKEFLNLLCTEFFRTQKCIKQSHPSQKISLTHKLQRQRDKGAAWWNNVSSGLTQPFYHFIIYHFITEILLPLVKFSKTAQK